MAAVVAKAEIGLVVEEVGVDKVLVVVVVAEARDGENSIISCCDKIYYLFSSYLLMNNSRE